MELTVKSWIYFLIAFILFFDCSTAKLFSMKVNLGGPREGDFLAEEEVVQLDPDCPKMRFHGELQGRGEDLEVFKTQRFARGQDLVLRFPVPDGIYSVTLLFAETWSGAFQRGARLFDVYVGSSPNGIVKVISFLDMFAAAGGATPIRRMFKNIVSKDGITVALRPVKQNPQIAGVIIEGHTFEGTNMNELPNVPLGPHDSMPDFSALTRAGPTVPVDPSLLYNPDLDPKYRNTRSFSAASAAAQPSSNNYGSLSLNGLGSPSSGSPPASYSNSPSFAQSDPGVYGNGAFTQATSGGYQGIDRSIAQQGTDAAVGYGTQASSGSGVGNSNLGNSNALNSLSSGAQGANGFPIQNVGGSAGQITDGVSNPNENGFDANAGGGFSGRTATGFGSQTAGSYNGNGPDASSQGATNFGSAMSPGLDQQASGQPSSGFIGRAIGYGSQPNSQRTVQGPQEPGFDSQMGHMYSNQQPPRRRLLQFYEGQASRDQENLIHKIEYLSRQRQAQGRDFAPENGYRPADGGTPSNFLVEPRVKVQEYSHPVQGHVEAQPSAGIFSPPGQNSFNGGSNSLGIYGQDNVQHAFGNEREDPRESRYSSGNFAASSRAEQPVAGTGYASLSAERPMLQKASSEDIDVASGAAARFRDIGNPILQNNDAFARAANYGVGSSGIKDQIAYQMDHTARPDGRYATSKFVSTDTNMEQVGKQAPTASGTPTVTGGDAAYQTDNGSLDLHAPPQPANGPFGTGNIVEGAQSVQRNSEMNMGRNALNVNGVKAALDDSRTPDQSKGYGDLSASSARAVSYPSMTDVSGLGEDRRPRHPGIDDPRGHLDRLCINNATHCSCGMSNVEPESECLFVLSESTDPKLCRRDRCNARFVCGCAAESGMLCERKVARTILVQAQTNEKTITAHPNVVLCTRKTVDMDIPILEPVLGHL
jgi:Malectin domain